MKMRPTRLEGPDFATKRSGIALAMCCTTAWVKPFAVSVPDLGLHGHDEVKALPAGRLEPALEAKLREQRAHQLRRLPDLRPLHPFAGIEIEDEAIGLGNRLSSGVPRVQLHRRELVAATRSSADSIEIAGWWPGHSAGSVPRSPRVPSGCCWEIIL